MCVASRRGDMDLSGLLWSATLIFSATLFVSPAQSVQQDSESVREMELLLRDEENQPTAFPSIKQSGLNFLEDEGQVYRLSLPLAASDYLNLTFRKPRRYLMSSDAKVQWEEGELIVAKTLPWRCLYEGFLETDTDDWYLPGTVVSLCGGLTGVFQIRDNQLHVRPVEEENVYTIYERNHVVRTVQVPDYGKKKFFDETVSWEEMEEAPAKAGRHRVLSRSKREVFHRNPRHIEVLLVADQTVVRFHGRSLVDQYLLTIMNIVNSVYHHPSLGIEINVIVVDIVHLSDIEMQAIIDEKKGKDTLQKFCSWSSERWHKAKSRNKREVYDVAVYLTKEDLGPAGYAPVTGMCNPQRSCAVIRDDGISSAFVVAHEIGHIFGMVHDGEGSAEKCANNENDGKIMSAMVQSNYQSYYWSNCSREMMESVLEEMYCLENEPTEVVWPRYSEPYGQTWTLDEQCRQEFGADFVFCSALPPNCEHLWCENPKESTMCKTKKSPPLSGTTCGKNMWCLDGRCVNMKDTPRIDGEWSKWSDWGECSRTCGVGVHYRYRTCTDPSPQYGGKECSGNGEDFRLCNKQDCPEVTDFRLEQCQYYNDINFAKNRRHNWLPIESKNLTELCKLTCVSEETGDLFTTEKNIVDGTPCSYESSHNICIRGECHRMGCDKELDSDTQEDLCGVCGGDNSNCSTVDGTYINKLGAGQYHRVLILPAQAMNIRIREKTTFHLAHFIAVRDLKTEKFWLNGETKHQTNRQFVVHKTRFLYFRSKNGEYLTARGPLLSPLEILVYSFSDRIPVKLDYQYYTLRERDEPEVLGPATEPNRYQWAVTSFDNCTRPCGGGTKREMFECLDIERNTVSEGLCSGSQRPSGSTVPCNEHLCSTTVYLWEVKPWQKCSQSCGTKGMKWRTVYCEATLMEDRWQVDDVYCDPATRPDAYKQCNRMACPAKWKVGEWSECSATCGEGQQTRQYYCDKPNDDNKYTCDHLEPPTTLRTCQVQPCPGGDSVTPPTSPSEQYSGNDNVNITPPTNTIEYDDPDDSGEDIVDFEKEAGGRGAELIEAGGESIDSAETGPKPSKEAGHRKANDVSPEKQAKKKRRRPNGKDGAKSSSSSSNNNKWKKTRRHSRKRKAHDPTAPRDRAEVRRERHRMKSNRHTSKDRRLSRTGPCDKDISGLVCRIAANRENCLTNSIYKKLCCKSCGRFITL